MARDESLDVVAHAKDLLEVATQVALGPSLTLPKHLKDRYGAQVRSTV